MRACGEDCTDRSSSDSGSGTPPVSQPPGSKPNKLRSRCDHQFLWLNPRRIAPGDQTAAVTHAKSKTERRRPEGNIRIQLPAACTGCHAKDRTSPGRSWRTQFKGSEQNPPPAVALSRTPTTGARSTGGPVTESAPSILLGSHENTPQFGLLGRHSDSTVAIDLTGCNTVSLFGVQGFGKSYTLGVIAEMATTEVPGINVLPSPLATVIFHYHKSDAYAPEFATASSPNNKAQGGRTTPSRLRCSPRRR